MSNQNQEMEKVVKLVKTSEKHLQETPFGISFGAAHAKMIWQGNKNLIVKSVENKDAVGKDFYVIEGNYCYNLIKILGVKPIDLKEFEELSSRHRINGNERKLWWGSAKQLYAYEFEVKKKFEFPFRVAALDSSQVFVDDVRFLSESDLKGKLSLSDLVGAYSMGSMVVDCSEFDLKNFKSYELVFVKKPDVLMEEVEPFKSFELAEVNREFTDKKELLAYLSGG